MPDVLSEIMRRVHLTACVYFQRDFCGPWAMRMADTGFAQFHVITSGACQLEVGGEIKHVGTGDVLFFPRGQAHVLSDQPRRLVVDGPDFMASLATGQPMFSEGLPTTRMICGHYAYRWEVTHPLLTQLPEVVHVRAETFGAASRIPVILELLLSELSQSEPGFELNVEHLAQILLIQTLRHHCRLDGKTTGFLAALSDARLGRAIAKIHSDFDQFLTLADLADAAAMSRSVFSQRFSETLMMAPVEYLLQWRMVMAQDLLLGTDSPVADIAEQVGYGSDIAFARAYKRQFGTTPTQTRKAKSDIPITV